MLGIFNSKKENWLIPTPKNFSVRYKMLTQNTFLMGVENKPLEMKTESILQINQRITDDSIETAVTVESINGDTPNKELQDHLATALALSHISKTLLFQRDSSGKFLFVKNKIKLKNDWEKWKNTEIDKLFKGKKEKEKFIINYEKGFEKIDQTIPLSFQNAILIPALYGFKSYQDSTNSFSPQSINSKLIADLAIRYKMVSTRTEVNNVGDAKIYLKSKLSNTDDMKIALEEIYSKSKGFSMKNYQFGINLYYILERETGKIIKCKFDLAEIVHDYLRYDLKIEFEEIFVNNEENLKIEEQDFVIKSGKKSSFLADGTEELKKENFSAESGTLKDVKYFVMNTRQDKVPVYEFPSAMVAPFTFLENGTAIDVIKYEKEGWCEILSKEKKKGYVQSNHVKKND